VYDLLCLCVCTCACVCVRARGSIGSGAGEALKVEDTTAQPGSHHRPSEAEGAAASSSAAGAVAAAGDGGAAAAAAAVDGAATRSAISAAAAEVVAAAAAAVAHHAAPQSPGVVIGANPRAALQRVFAWRMRDVWAPRAQAALAACLLGPGSHRPHRHHGANEQHEGRGGGGADPRMLRVSVEAVGSGIVIAPALSVARDSTVGELKELLLTRAVVNAPSAAAVRLFVGHGGPELCNDLLSLGASNVPDWATLVQVAVDEREVVAQLFTSADIRGAPERGSGRGSGLWGFELNVPLTRKSTRGRGRPWKGLTCNEGGRLIKLKLERRAQRAGAWVCGCCSWPATGAKPVSCLLHRDASVPRW
jgi:hypothetical protein